MLLIRYLSVLAPIFLANAVKICDVSYYKNALKAIGKKAGFQYYPWNTYENVERDIKFLSIRKDNVKQLCRSQLPLGVEEVVLAEVKLEYIEPGFFENSVVEQVLIQYNNLKTIRRGVFNGTNIKSLALSDNQIEQIEPNAFEDMHLLEAISLDDNRIKIWDSSWFRNTEILNEISFRNNLLEELPEHTTKHMVDDFEKFSTYTLYGSINFDNNKIRYIHPLAFNNLERFGSVSLSNNKLLELPWQVFDGFKFLHSLYLNTNDFICFPNATVVSFKGVKRLYLGRNRLNKNCVDIIRDFFSIKNDMVFF